jgi:VWFA-related protein
VARPYDDKKKRERFGSSLKRLKWDAAKQAATETKKEKAAQTAARSDDEAIKLETLFVALDVIVADTAASRFITGLGKDDFSVIEDGTRQQIATLATGDDARRTRSIVLIIDYSGSQHPYIAASVGAAKTLIAQLQPADEMAIVTDDVELLIDFTSDKARLRAALDQIERRVRKKDEDQFGRSVAARIGKSLQFSALFATLREMVKAEGVRPIIIFQTDGDEAVSLRDQPEADDYLANMPRREYGLADIFRAAERSRATIYTVIPSFRLTGLAPDKLYERGRQMIDYAERLRFETDREYLRYKEIFPTSDAKARLFTDRMVRWQEAASRAASLTGGWTAYLEKPGQAADIYARILSDINHRYIIGYYPTNTERDGRQRSVKVEVRNHPEYKVHGRTSYYAPD